MTPFVIGLVLASLYVVSGFSRTFTKEMLMTTQATSAPSRQETNPETALPREQIEERAYYRYLERGRADGHALEDWVTAEAELNQRRRGISV
jgi:hypothetical protein